MFYNCKVENQKTMEEFRGKIISNLKFYTQKTYPSFEKVADV